MAVKPVQISLGLDLLKRIDSDPEVQEKGRSAFVREACEVYLKVRERRAVDSAIDRAYSTGADDMLAEVEDLIEEQEWPDD
jgi:metal-responsive CopG/Arc/MetJ family transcriptional regulator